MSKVSLPRKHHRHRVLVGRLDHLRISLGPARLDDATDARGREMIDAVSEREESVGGQHRPAREFSRPRDRLADRLDARCLSPANTDRHSVANEHDRVGLHMFADPLREFEALENEQ